MILVRGPRAAGDPPGRDEDADADEHEGHTHLLDPPELIRELDRRHRRCIGRWDVALDLSEADPRACNEAAPEKEEDEPNEVEHAADAGDGCHVGGGRGWRSGSYGFQCTAKWMPLAKVPPLTVRKPPW